MTSITCAFALLCAVLMVPLMLFVWALETKWRKINRFRALWMNHIIFSKKEPIQGIHLSKIG